MDAPIPTGGSQQYLVYIVHVRKWSSDKCHQAKKIHVALVAGDVVEGDCTLLGHGVAVDVIWLFTAASVFFLTWEHGNG